MLLYYADLILQIYKQVISSEEDYFRREKVFMEKIVGFIENNKVKMRLNNL